MRRWLVFVMIALLPLRSWAGDLMTLQMAAGSTDPATVLMAPDCPMQMAADHAGAGTCCSCELCIPIAELPGVVLQTAGAAVHQRPLTSPRSSVSAALDTIVKPPAS